jgi:hypothetical protein
MNKPRRQTKTPLIKDEAFIWAFVKIFIIMASIFLAIAGMWLVDIGQFGMVNAERYGDEFMGTTGFFTHPAVKLYHIGLYMILASVGLLAALSLYCILLIYKKSFYKGKQKDS